MTILLHGGASSVKICKILLQQLKLKTLSATAAGPINLVNDRYVPTGPEVRPMLPVPESARALISKTPFHQRGLVQDWTYGLNPLRGRKDRTKKWVLERSWIYRLGPAGIWFLYLDRLPISILLS